MAGRKGFSEEVIFCDGHSPFAPKSILCLFMPLKVTFNRLHQPGSLASLASRWVQSIRRTDSRLRGGKEKKLQSLLLLSALLWFWQWLEPSVATASCQVASFHGASSCQSAVTSFPSPTPLDLRVLMASRYC